MNDKNCERSIAASGDYIAALLEYQKKPVDDNLSTALLELLQKYKFGRYVPNDNDAEFVRKSAYEIKKQVVSEENILSRIRMGFWNALR